MRTGYFWLSCLSLFLVYSTVSPCHAGTYRYEESRAPLLAPERGFYKYYYRKLDGSLEFIDLVSNRDFSWARKNGVSLVSARISLEKFRNTDVPQYFLDQLDKGFEAVRAGGVKVILRFNYNNKSNPGPDTTLSWMVRHISQLRDVLNRNADVIAVIQAGFLGAWGEWHTSMHGLDNFESRRVVVESLLNSIPENLNVQLRYPQHKEILYGSPLREGTAFTNSYPARIGHHIDCILASENDLTYPLNQINHYIDYIAQDGEFVPVGGETCKRYPPRTSCAVALSVMGKLHFSYLNANYRQEVIDSWRSEGCYDEIASHLGYRLIVRESTYDETARAGWDFSVETLIENTGWAAPFNSRKILITLESSTGESVQFELDSDIRKLGPRRINKLSTMFRLPSNMKSGTYSLFLSAPDPSPNLQSRDEYAIPFANNGYQTIRARLPLGQVSVKGN